MRSTIAIVYGSVDPAAPADEKDVLVQVETVRASLESLGYRTVQVPVTLDLASAAQALRAAAPGAVFNLAETIDGKGSLIHLVPALLTSMGIPFTGAPCEAIVLTSHKLLAKKIFAAEGIPTPRWMTVAEARTRGLSAAPAWIVKSVWEHASIGLEDSAVVGSAAALERELARRAARDASDGLFLEEFIDGREFNLALLAGPNGGEPQSLPPAEIQFVGYAPGKPRMVGYNAKWAEGSAEYSGTPRVFDFPREDEPLREELVRISRDCWRLFALRGYARVDFRVDAASRPLVLEINTNPCLTPDAGFMAAAARAGLSMDTVVARIIADAAVARAACMD